MHLKFIFNIYYMLILQCYIVLFKIADSLLTIMLKNKRQFCIKY